MLFKPIDIHLHHIYWSIPDGSHNSVASTPRSALKRVSNIPEEPEDEPEIEPAAAGVLDFRDIENQKHMFKSEKEFNQAKKLLRLAFVEFYRGLGLLSNYRYSLFQPARANLSSLIRD